MKSGSSRNLWIILSVCLVIFGCAKISVPTGGPKDKEIPVVLKCLPENGALNFKGNEILITFNEYVILDKISEKFMVSPPMKKRPDISVKGKGIRIKYDETLRDSTTYTLYFQDAIKDLNEGNAIPNFQFVFSTGSFIDSLSVTGNVYSGFTLDPPENTLVLLYDSPADTAVMKQLPAYITRATANGEFRIDNVHQGIYRLYALTDLDNSKNYNNRDEFFAFYDRPVRVTPETNYLPVAVKKDTVIAKPAAGSKIPFVPPLQGEYQLVLFQAEKKMHYLTSSSRKTRQQLVYTLSLPPDSMDFGLTIPDAEAGSFFTERSRNRDTITVWLTDSTIYNRQEIETIIDFPFTDTLGITGIKRDTVPMRFIMPRAVRGRAAKPTPYKVTANISGQVRPDARIIMTAPSPFMPPDTSRILFYEVMKESKVRHNYDFSKDSANSCRYFINTDIKPGRSYIMITDSAAFKSIYGDISDSTAIRFTVQDPESYGELTLNLSGYDGNVIINVLDNTEKIIRQAFIKGNEKIRFPLLEKGKYRIRAVFDLNDDGKWTTGDFESDRQPEPVVYYKEELDIPANWQIEQPWELVPGNFKDPKLQKIKTTAR
jgi:hypothetical protein